MNKIKIVMAAALCIGLSQFNSLLAQTDTNTPPIPSGTGSFFDTAKNYFTSFNTNNDDTFGLAKGEVAVGIDSIQGGGATLANSVRVSYNAYKSVGVDAVVLDGGVAGTIIGYQVGPALNFVIHDAKLSLYGHAGYRQEKIANDPQQLYGEIGVRVSKALTAHTFAGVGVGVRLPNQERIFSAFTGFTF